MAGDVAHPSEKKKKLRPLQGEESWGKFGKPKSECDFCGVFSSRTQDKKESSLSKLKRAFGELRGVCRVLLANYFTFSHIFSFPNFLLLQLFIHWGKMAGRLDCQCYCATWFQALRAAPTESAGGQAHTNTVDRATKGCQRSSRPTMEATRKECSLANRKSTDSRTIEKCFMSKFNRSLKSLLTVKQFGFGKFIFLGSK